MKPFGPCWLLLQGLICWAARLCRHRQPRDGAGGSGQRWQRQSRDGKRAALQLQKGGGHIAAGCFQGLLLGLVMVWTGVALVSRYSSLAAARLVSGWLWQANAAVVMALSLMGLLLWRRRENMRRLLAGTESKIASKKK